MSIGNTIDTMRNVEEAFRVVDRANFLPEEVRSEADYDVPLPIGYGQTNSQPTTVRWMLEWLDPQPGETVLDIGSGSGWTTALLAQLVGPKGKVYAVEKVPELVKFGAENCQRTGISNVRFYHAGEKFGQPEHAPYDRILVSAAAFELPNELKKQLKVGGRLVIPVRHSIWVINKTGNDSYESQEHPGFVFVPLI